LLIIQFCRVMTGSLFFLNFIYFVFAMLFAFTLLYSHRIKLIRHALASEIIPQDNISVQVVARI
jgi:hypothetical protein